MAIDYAQIFSEVAGELKNIEDCGRVAEYIPELKNVDANKFGLHLTTIDKHHYAFGDSTERFSIQSIAKVLSLTLAFALEEDNLWNRVGVEPSGTAFNSLVQLEYENGIPRNPLINAGALVVCDILVSQLKNPQQAILELARKLSGKQTVDFSARVAESEQRTSFHNAAMLNLMKSYGNIQNEIEDVLDLYCKLCSIEMSCEELAQTFSYLALNGSNPLTGEKIISASKTKRINAIMQLCGFYDEAGEFSFKVGLPGKSGVGGGIIAIHPEQYSIAVWSPKLNAKGNSHRGVKILEFLTTRTQSSIF